MVFTWIWVLLCFLGVAFCFCMLLIASGHKSLRRPFALTLLTVLSIFGIGSLGKTAADTVYWSSLDQLVERSKPLTDAIDKFAEAENRLPTQLSDLVPKYISAIPKTGMGAFPDFKIHRPDDPGIKFIAVDRWYLYIDLSQYMGSFLELRYRPDGNYTTQQTGLKKKVGNWFYHYVGW